MTGKMGRVVIENDIRTFVVWQCQLGPQHLEELAKIGLVRRIHGKKKGVARNAFSDCSDQGEPFGAVLLYGQTDRVPRSAPRTRAFLPAVKLRLVHEHHRLIFDHKALQLQSETASRKLIGLLFSLWQHKQ